MKICPKCNAKYRDDCEFCTHDAEKLVQGPSDADMPRKKPHKSSSDFGMLPFIGIFILIVCIAGGAYYYLHRKPPEPKPSALSDINTISSVYMNRDYVTNGMKLLPDGYSYIQFPSAVAYVPKDFKPVEVPITSAPAQDMSSQLALMGTLNRTSPKPSFFNLTVLNIKSNAIQQLNTADEAAFLKNIFIGFWQSDTLLGSKSLKREIVSLDYFKTFYGHMFLNVNFTSQPPDDASKLMFNSLSFYLFGNTIYVVALNTPNEFKDTFAKDFDAIITTFNASPKDIK